MNHISAALFGGNEILSTFSWSAEASATCARTIAAKHCARLYHNTLLHHALAFAAASWVSSYIARHMVSALCVRGGTPMHALMPDFASTILSLHPVSPLKHEPKSLLQFGEKPIVGGGEFLIGRPFLGEAANERASAAVLLVGGKTTLAQFAFSSTAALSFLFPMHTFCILDHLNNLRHLCSQRTEYGSGRLVNSLAGRVCRVVV